MSVTIRNAQFTDADQVASLKNMQLEDFIHHVEYRLSEMEAGRACYLVAELNGQIVGHVFLKFTGKATEPDYPDIEDLYTHADFRQQGIATLLLSHCEMLTLEKGFSQIGLATSPDPEETAHRLYLKLGYIPIGREPYIDGVYNGVEDWVIDLVKGLK